MNCRLKTDFPHSEIKKLFATELERQHARSEVKLTKSEGKAVFEIVTKDVTAMRASLNSITSILSVYDKTRSK